MGKSDALNRWKGLKENADPLPHFQPIPYKSEGSSYGACGVRIDGSPEFIDAVLSRLKPLIAAENHVTRLELARSVVKPALGKVFAKAGEGAEVCYIRCHVRGGEGAAMSARFDRRLDNATRRFATAQGII